MIRKNLFFVLLAICSICGLVSCNGRGGDFIEVVSYGIVNENPEMGGYTLISTIATFGEMAVPEIPPTYRPGQCVLAFYTLDYDNQPSKDYITATDVQILTPGGISQSYARVVDEVDKEDPEYNVVLKQVDFVSTSHLRGKVFFEIRYDAPKGQTLDYSLECDINDIDKNGYLNLYLRAKKTNEQTGDTVGTIDPFVFDAYSLLRNHGKDSTDAKFSEIKYKCLNVNVKYLKEIKEKEKKNEEEEAGDGDKEIEDEDKYIYVYENAKGVISNLFILDAEATSLFP
jgi:hypothetical protein